MRGITIAIGKQGIQFFVEHYLKDRLIQKFHDIRENRSIYVGPGPQNENPRNHGLDGYWFGDYDDGAAQLTVALTDGTLEHFNPSFTGVTQGANGSFDLGFTASNFDMQYQWAESYYHQWRGNQDFPPDPEHFEQVNNQSRGAYSVNIGELTVNIKARFEYEEKSKTWEFMAQEGSVATVKPGSTTPAPGRSYVAVADSCFSTHVSAQANSAIVSIGFANLLNDQIRGILASIPGSGDLGGGIKYDFSLGDPQGLAFPNDHGIQIGVKGGASYKNTPFDESNHPELPLPLPPADSDIHHLNMYVSKYEVDALHWAYFQAGLLNTIVNPGDLPDPKVLKVHTYVEWITAFVPYGPFAMQAIIKPKTPPDVQFATVWEFTTDTLADLKSQLPGSVYKNLCLGISAPPNITPPRRTWSPTSPYAKWTSSTGP